MAHWQQRLQRIEALLGRTGRLLDIGCAVGQFQLAAEARGWTTVGIEPSVPQSDYPRRHFQLDVRTAIWETATFDDGEFDLITAWSVLEHVRDPAGFLRQIRRWLKPAGLLALQTPNQASLIADLAGWGYRLSWGRYLLPIYSAEHLYRFDAGPYPPVGSATLYAAGGRALRQSDRHAGAYGHGTVPAAPQCRTSCSSRPRRPAGAAEPTGRLCPSRRTAGMIAGSLGLRALLLLLVLIATQSSSFWDPAPPQAPPVRYGAPALPGESPVPLALPAPGTLRWRAGAGVSEASLLAFAWPAPRPGWVHNWTYGLFEADGGLPPLAQRRITPDAAEAPLAMEVAVVLRTRGGRLYLKPDALRAGATESWHHLDCGQ